MKATISPAAAEGSECAALYDGMTALDTDTLRMAGAAFLRVGGGVALSVRADPAHFWTKALGFGFARPVNRHLIGQLTDFYREQDVPVATLQLAPSVIPANWDEISAAAKLSADGELAKLVCETEVAVTRAGAGLYEGLRVGPVAPDQRAEWSTTMMGIFGMLDGYSVAMAAACVGRPGWHPYAVWAGEQIVATAAMYVNGETAQFFGGSTLPEYRGRGAQTALIAARASAARAAGCRWLVAETEPEAPGGHVTSLRNLRRVGFEVLYERTNWTWRLAEIGQ
ncbi:MAG: GNAT family N-acetyltransferase [Trebonia sp.]